MRGRQFNHFNGRINAEKFTSVLFYMYDFLFVTIATIILSLKGVLYGNK